MFPFQTGLYFSGITRVNSSSSLFVSYAIYVWQMSTCKILLYRIIRSSCAKFSLDTRAIRLIYIKVNLLLIAHYRIKRRMHWSMYENVGSVSLRIAKLYIIHRSIMAERRLRNAIHVCIDIHFAMLYCQRNSNSRNREETGEKKKNVLYFHQ